MAIKTYPSGLEDRGKSLWDSVHKAHPEMNDAEREVLLEACRVADRLERLDVLCRESDPVIPSRVGMIPHPAFTEARQQQNLLKQLVASLRIPDATGRRAAERGNRGAYQPKGAGQAGSVTSIRDRLRSA